MNILEPIPRESDLTGLWLLEMCILSSASGSSDAKVNIL